MARIDSGSVTVTSSGTAVQISSSIAASARVTANAKILSIEISVRSDNSGAAMYFGSSNVTTSYGRRILKGSTLSIDLDNNGSDSFDALYMDADSNNDVADWTVTF